MKRKLVYPLLALIAFAFVIGCSKKTDDPVAPDLAATASGTYLVNSVTQSTTTVAVPASANYTITLNRVSNNVVDMVLKGSGTIPSVTLSGTPSVITFQKSYTVSATSTSNASGDITNGTITLSTIEGGVPYKIVAKK